MPTGTTLRSLCVSAIAASNRIKTCLSSNSGSLAPRSSFISRWIFLCAERTFKGTLLRTEKGIQAYLLVGIRRHEEHEPAESRQGGVGARAEEIGQQMVELRLSKVSGIVGVGRHRVIESREEAVRLQRSGAMLVDDGLVQSMGLPLAIEERLHYPAVSRQKSARSGKIRDQSLDRDREAVARM